MGGLLGHLVGTVGLHEISLGKGREDFHDAAEIFQHELLGCFFRQLAVFSNQDLRHDVLVVGHAASRAEARNNARRRP
ncbi:hypothetical protein [Streptomyces sp. NBC_00859]|uniref:hypothetical protein n=1 Tax=Streptomyces sp. NBC_00859 TaxID=2903682 RepID=UPI00386B9031|nr:hypothetical protein OG584_33885 [Streptomyces sp. NBC_00859]